MDMDTTQQRGRSPSASHHIRQSPSPSPQPSFLTNLSGLGLDHHTAAPAAADSSSSYGSPLNSQLSATGTTPSFDLASHYLVPPDQSQHYAAQPLSDSTFLQSRDSPFHSGSPQLTPQGGVFPPNLLHSDSAISGSSQEESIDPSFLLDPKLLEPQQPPPQDQSIDPSTLMNQMATTQAHSPTPPHLLQPDMNRSSVSPHASPSLAQGSFPSPSHSRHASLDPSSAAFPQNHTTDWSNVGYRSHRRAPSDTYSDVSSSAHPSPYMGNNESFDHENPSPLLNPQQDAAMFQDVMSFGQFTISDNHSPAHSPHISPRLMPQQQSLPPFTAANNYGLASDINPQFQRPGGIDYLRGPGEEPFPPMPQGAPGDYGHSDQMSPPEINIDFAPPSRQQSFEPPKIMTQENALSPPDRSRGNRGRLRARSDPFSGASSRASTPSGQSEQDSLSPNAAKLASRSPSPSQKSSRRSSTSNIPHRDYILDLADPTRPTSNSGSGDGSSKGRTQKHPATFQCSLCPKRFTRAYNLRSHLRTHTDERPFVCSVCGKAFARQHDRKRHEGLHSGEKKFVCRGVLKDGNNWGCGRRFARADALGRHFRSEAGRVCIRPLLEEEAREKGWEAQAHSMESQPGMLGTMAPPHLGPMHMQGPPGYDQFPPVSGGMEAGIQGVAPPPGHPGAYALPAALLAQYPALAGIQWDTLPPGPPPDELEGELSGRSSFDASSGGEMFDDEDGEYGRVPGAAYGWASDNGM